MTKPSLVVLAAGMGSRYGGLKQLDQFGPHGETIIDYSLYDAIQAGFGKVVFIIRDFFASEFKATFGPKLAGRIEVDYVLQEINKIPSGITVHAERQKPWGTGHAVMMAAEVVNEPFAVINADDYYGQDAYGIMHNFLMLEASPSRQAFMGYYLYKTLSEHGHVNRGVCRLDENGNMQEVIETINIEKRPSGDIVFPQGDHFGHLVPDTIVSMNFWGFHQSYFKYAEEDFRVFLQTNGMNPKAEYYIPVLVDKLIKSGQSTVKTLISQSDWFGVTYQEDKPQVTQRIKALLEAGVYPQNLWS